MPVPSPETIQRMCLALAGVVRALYETEDGLDYDTVWTADTLDDMAEAVGREHTLCAHCGVVQLFSDPATCRCAGNRTI